MASFDEIYTLFLAILGAGFVDRQHPGCPNNSTFDRLGELKIQIHQSCADGTFDKSVRLFKLAFLLDIFFGISKECVAGDYAIFMEFIASNPELMTFYDEVSKLFPKEYKNQEIGSRFELLSIIFESI
jgi:hypothetical protein